MLSRVYRRATSLAGLLLISCLILQVMPGSSFPTLAAPQPETASWTFMVYMAADNNLEGAGIDDFLEMATAGSDDNLNIIVQYDRTPGYDSRYDNWTTTKRFRVTPGMAPTIANALMDIGEANMGDPQTVIDFVTWARANYPADHYALIFWNHGGGWLSDLSPRPEGVTPEDFCWDDTNGGDALTSAELYQCLDVVTLGGAQPIDQVGFDACLMAMWEVDDQIKPFGSAVSLSSEETEPWDGWPYELILADLKANPGWTPAALGYDIVERYYQSYGNDQTMSAKDLAAAYTGLNDAVDTLALALIEYETTYHNQYNTARNATQNFGTGFLDLYDFAAKLNVYVTEPEINAAASGVMAAVDAAVINERHGGYWPGAHGIDFYFPSSTGTWAAYQALRSSQITHWDEFVYYHIHGGTVPCAEAFIEDVSTSAAGAAVTFTPSVHGDEPLEYLWSFGDGETSTEASPVHVYQASGTYAVTLELTNCSGQGQSTWSGVVEVVAGIVVQPPALSAVLAPDEAAGATLWITNGGAVDLSWTLTELAPDREAEAAARQMRPRSEPVVDADLAVKAQSGGRVQAVIALRGLADLSAAYAIRDKGARRQFVYDRLRATAERSGGDLWRWLEARGARPRLLWAANAIVATLDARTLAVAAARPEVAHIAAPRVYRQGAVLPGQSASGPDEVEWNIAKIRADQAWSELGVTGEGAVVGNIGTGVMYDHEALVGQYRGNLGGGSFDHNYNWFDFVDGQPVPFDPVNHSTFGMGLAVGDDGGDDQIGVAPGARWIAVRACGYGCTDVDLLEAGQWMLAPTRLDGSHPDPGKAPDLVFNMWGGGTCDPWYDTILTAWQAANILPIFAPGGAGPGCSTVASPADSAYVMSAGATDASDLIAPFSARGPSQCGGLIKPEVSAPGVDVRSSTTDGGYQVWSGTSFSAAHLAGVAALVLSADPSLGTNEAASIIEETALCIENLSCGGTPCPDGANNVYGWGRVDAYEAVVLALAGTDALPWLDESPLAGTLAPGESVAVDVTFDSAGLSEGEYTGVLDVASDDPETPHVLVPVTLTVEIPCLPAHIEDVQMEADGCSVTFTPEVTGTGPIWYFWDFGPFGTFGAVSPTVDFGETGTYTGTLEVGNCAGAGHDAYEVTVDVECAECQPAHILAVTLDQDGCSITFGAEVTGTPPISYTWDFGAFGVSFEPEPVVDFGANGTYPLTLTVENCEGTAGEIVTKNVNVTCQWMIYVPVILKND